MLAASSGWAQDEQPISIKTLPANVVQDQKEIWRFPLKPTKGVFPESRSGD
jgi:hypothetical protein